MTNPAPPRQQISGFLVLPTLCSASRWRRKIISPAGKPSGDSESGVKTSLVKPKILVVDDDEHLRTLLCVHLDHEGFEVASARDGQQGLQLFIAQPPEIVLTDRQMPHLTGEELASRIRALQPDAKILLMTGSDLDDLPAGLFDALLAKPFGMPDLREAIASAHRARRTHRAAA